MSRVPMALALGLAMLISPSKGSAVAEPSTARCKPVPEGTYRPPGTKWNALPSGPDIERVYPTRARELQLEGRAVLGCVSTAEGRLTGCQVELEEPAGMGFGEATLRLAGRFQLGPPEKLGPDIAGYCMPLKVTYEIN